MRITCFTLAMLAAASLATATDYYVASTGSDGSSGTITNPYATFSKALGQAIPGDTVLVRGGTYRQRVSFPRNGTASAPIVFRAYPGETPVIDLSGAAVPSGNGDEPVISVLNRSNIVVQGFTIQYWQTSDPNSLPEGILLGARSGNNQCTNVRILGNTIHHIEQNSSDTSNSGDAHGIKVAGRSVNPVSGIVIDGNHLYRLRLGSSEALVINGNVTDWRITNNRVHDCNNIGIDMIGYENLANLPVTLDRARNGVCAGNVVYNIDARFNPAYNGNFTLGGGDPSAGGIYVDGGTNIVIERNLVYACNFGVELASEYGSGFTDSVILRNNVIRHNHQQGLLMGGYASNRGTTTNCSILNNTLYLNGTFANQAQIGGQYYISNCVFRNNIVVANTSRYVLDITNSAAATFTSNVFSHNLYYSASGAPRFDNYPSLTAWQAAASVSGGDTGSTAENPLFDETTPTITTSVLGYRPGANSPAINTGQPSPSFQPGSGEQDLSEHSRVRGGRVDRGAFER